jgi:inner membrane protein
MLGAAWAQPAAKTSKVLPATLIGGISGMTPDLDLLIRSNSDPLLAIEFHRHFTHSLFFVPFGALICALSLYPIFKSALTFGHCYLFSVLGFASHGLLDACTSYGTLLLWPFSNNRIAWDLISVVDPLFTLPLIACVAVGALKARPVFALIGVGWCLAYLALGFLLHERAETAVRELASSRGHAPTAVAAKPSFGNLLVWKTLYAHDDRFFIDAVRVGISAKSFAGEQRRIPDIERDFPWLTADTQQARDIERFSWFTDGYLGVDPEKSNRLVDLRYSLVPNSANGFWGIELNPGADGDAHAAYVTMRFRSAEEGRQLLRMLFQSDP